MLNQLVQNWNQKIANTPQKTLLLWACIYTTLIYLLLHTNYYLYYVDDTWEMAKSWYFIHEGITEDVLFRHPDAPDRTQVFCTTFY